jgi:hypothetical protein
VPYFTRWQLGTPLPTVPAGYTIEAMPSQASMAGIQMGTQLQMTPVSLPTSGAQPAAASAAAAATTALAQNANSADYVNLVVFPPGPAGPAYWAGIKNYDEGNHNDVIGHSARPRRAANPI